ncbi:MAG: phosphatase PAP2 family protein [Clostridium sp.]|uniref:phosphatase PAP2 family protein n=1 Tax=Clostridium sp. TaxID=1506 RepID=UPI0030563357
MNQWLYSIDKGITDFIHYGLQNDFFDAIMPYITKLGDVGIVWIVISIILMCMKKYRRVGFACLLSLITCAILTEGIIKHIFERVRPIVAYPIDNPLIKLPTSSSFPSGHTGSSVAVTYVLCTYIKRYKPYFISLAVLIGFSRIYLYVHYFSDILGGVVVGIISGILAVYIIKKIYKGNNILIDLES